MWMSLLIIREPERAQSKTRVPGRKIWN